MRKYYKYLFLLIIVIVFIAIPFFTKASVPCLLDCSNLEVVNEVEQHGLVEATLLENRGLGFAFVMLAGLVDGSNVCALSLLLLFMGYLAIFVKDRKRSMKLGFVFLVTVFVSYFLLGVIFSSTIQTLINWEYFSFFKNIFNLLLISLLLITGLLNFQDFFFSKKFIFDINSWEKLFIKKNLNKIDISSTLFIGIFSTIFLLPCSLPIYITSVNVLVSTFHYVKTIGYILVYDLFFILPLLLTFAIILRMEKIISDKDIHSGKFRWLKLIKGLIQIGAGVGLLLIL